MSIGHTHKIFIITYIGTQTVEPKLLCIGTKCSAFIVLTSGTFVVKLPMVRTELGICLSGRSSTGMTLFY
jgi:hypothetical protein